ncbi:RagB/SusD family nutrient uptake outer membrane protein [Mariniflexile litorale]|uniref:RagB/SusD family nutrient uptake outer membrane protein n=1 Tax=Mariniflexile litorale TaxID=3045158 RepID=A0AAU7EDT0_9FLAO|nr:RagB/SusD family nutrient uptake outer membrane protein [Mariniflexile sp. KMM 9835]MDQ8213475.1 RagB/SusD family nutrient uptake outer membrane protein [Mariniflexile sp. KMM 9835]
MMKLKKDNYHTTKPRGVLFTNALGFISYPFLCFLMLVSTHCTDFVEIDPPKNTLISETVFEDVSTVESALASMYFKIREQGMISGKLGLSALMGIYTDELDYYGSNTNYLQLYNHKLSASNSLLSDWWSHAYNLIYASNAIIKGLENSKTISVEDQAPLKGQALFVRAYMHSLLVNLYGEIPYITTTDYLQNNKVSRLPVTQVYTHSIADLTQAVSLLNVTDVTGIRVVPYQAVAKALLARLYLYTENWKMAEATAGELISAYKLEPNVKNVFLKNSKETLWQLKPNGVTDRNTYEANQFVIRFIPGQSYALSKALLDTFEPNDLRLLNWTGSTTSSNGLTTLHYAHKYKAIFSETASLEYSIIFRLAEQYLIRAEARAHLGAVSGAQEDLNSIRNRAGLGNTTATLTNDLLAAILQERHTELFTEQGHRWFDIKRMGVASLVLSPLKPNWQPTDVLLPIPETEIETNPNLKPQNLGYE